MTVPGLRVRLAVPADIAAVSGLETDCLGTDAWGEGLIREGITGALPTVAYLVAEAHGVVVGHAVASMAGDIAELQRIAVTQDLRRTGIATALLSGVVEVAAGTTEADRMLLEVRADNGGAIAFYAGRGFVEVDRRKCYYADGGTALVLRLDLRPGCGSAA